ncbi:MAG: hypothetical protein PUC05_09335, partial [Firmicutes bacterium]|nr:hypothetical protein [Bacillota bacterium]
YDGTNWVSAEGKVLQFKVNGAIPAEGTQILWEPGCTYELPALRVVNKGDLALKYKVVITGIQGDAELNEVIDWTINDAPINLTERHLAAGAADSGFVIKGHMQEDAGNEYQGKFIDGIGITVVATQDTVEFDSTTNQYDAGAVYPVVTAEEFTEALEAIGTSGTIVLGSNITLNDTPIRIDSGKDITVDTGEYTIKSIWTPASASSAFEVKENSTLTLKGNGTVEAYAVNPDVTWAAGFPGYANNAISNRGTLIIDGATVKVTTDKVGAHGELGASYCVDCYAGSKLEVRSGSIVNTQNIAVRIFTSDASKSVDVTVAGGTIEGSRAIWLQLAGNNSAVAPKVNIVINGGTIRTNEDFSDSNNYCLALYSYSYGNSFANTNVTINGGDFLGYVAFGGGYKGDRENVTINGGTFTAYNTDGSPDTDCVGRYTTSGWESIAH